MATTVAGRRYETTHPWITFSFDLSRLTHMTWLLLGEAQSKCEHVAGVPLKPRVADELNSIYISKGAHGTTSIEGNTLSEEEVLRRVEDDLELPKSREYLGEEIDNIVALYNLVIRDAFASQCPVTIPRLLLFHERLLRGQPEKDDVTPGALRDHTVGVGPYLGVPAEDCEYLLDRLCEWLSTGFQAPADKPELQFALNVVKAMIAHLYIAWIHPFADGNGRIARLVEFELLVQAGVPIPAAHVLSDHYNLTRTDYYAVLARTSRDPRYPVEAFVHYAMQGFVDQLRAQLGKVREHQMEVTWENHVHELFRDQDTVARRRQKHIALDLPAGRATKRAELRGISPRVAEAYAGKTAKTVSRDINQLVEKGLIRRTSKGIEPNRERIRAFLAPRAPEH